MADSPLTTIWLAGEGATMPPEWREGIAALFKRNGELCDHDHCEFCTMPICEDCGVGDRSTSDECLTVHCAGCADDCGPCRDDDVRERRSEQADDIRRFGP